MSSSSWKKIWWWWFNGLGGTVHGSFYKAPLHVNLQQPAGTTPAPSPVTLHKLVMNIVTLQYFIYSPNLVWFFLTFLLWQTFPYHLHNVQYLSFWEHIKDRIGINLSYILLYDAYWHGSLYGWWGTGGTRPFCQNRIYRWHKVWHNLFYVVLGILQWTVTEAAFLICYQAVAADSSLTTTNHHDKENTASALWWPPNNNNNSATFFVVVVQVLWILSVPLIREVHFYFAHRMLHLRFLYKYIHAVHHRTSDIEPFAGLAMHPVEHLYYFTCYGPLILVMSWCSDPCWHPSPFILQWMALHTLLSPAASHSGYEDHWSCDLYHYLHHRYYECNYAGGIPFDRFFGTYRDTLVVEEKDGNHAPAPRDPKATLRGMPDHVWFQLLAVLLPIGLLCWVATSSDWKDDDNDLHRQYRYVAALFVATAPLLVAAALYQRPPGQGILAPFDRDSRISQIGHLGLGFVLAVLPAVLLIEQTLQAAATLQKLY